MRKTKEAKGETISVISMRRKERSEEAKLGFTFVELFLVILLIGVIVLLALPRFRPTFSSLELLNFSRKVSSLMRYAQSKAIAEGEVIYFLHNEKDNFFFLTRDSPESKEREILEKKFFLSIPESIKVVFSEAKEFVFLPDGSIDFVERKDPMQFAKIIIAHKNEEFPKFQIIPQGIIGKIVLEELYE
ncbi:MAG: hypothetical protein NC834_07055 [Candidatus Omnitrophica bacterium]|nr:hypothetical protein [Candidatus Omnitrophota bacterium]